MWHLTQTGHRKCAGRRTGSLRQCRAHVVGLYNSGKTKAGLSQGQALGCLIRVPHQPSISRLKSLMRVSTLSRHGCTLAIPALRKLRQEDSQYEVSPGYMMKPYLKTRMFFLVPAGVGTVPAVVGWTFTIRISGFRTPSSRKVVFLKNPSSHTYPVPRLPWATSTPGSNSTWPITAEQLSDRQLVEGGPKTSWSNQSSPSLELCLGQSLCLNLNLRGSAPKS